MTIKAETATVYFGGGRRWLTLKGACRAEAKARIKPFCECSEGDHITPPETCWHHAPENYPRLIRRLARLHMAAAKALKEAA